MVRKSNTPARPRQPMSRPPDIQIMTEAQALHAFEEENHVLHERLAVLEENRSHTPMPIPTPEPPDSSTAILLPPPSNIRRSSRIPVRRHIRFDR